MSHRWGLTLLESLLLIAIVLLAIGLLIPAVLRVREEASRARCAKNLGDISLGFLSFHDTHGALPPGGTSSTPGDGADPDRRTEWSWSYHILPYVGHVELARSDDRSIARTPLALYYCTSRRPVALYEGWAKTDYAGNAGSTEDGRDGVVMRGEHPTLRLADFHDGPSNTLLVAERRLNKAELGRSEDDDAPFHRPGWGDWEAYRWGRTPPALDESAPGTLEARQGFGSSHRVGLNAAFADGSVRHISYNIAASVWLRACIRQSHRTTPKPIP